MVVQEDQEDGDSSTIQSEKKHRLKQRFDVRQKLGQGTYGKVQLAVNRETGQVVAIKTIKKCKIESEQDLVRIRREIQIMSSIQHPHIIHIYEVFENKDKIVLVMQFASGGELYDYLSEKKVLSDVEARRIFRQIAAAAYYCHKNKICHRDLKLENILLDEKGNAKIADFGLSNVFDERHLLKTYCGSPLYASPEIVKGVPYYGPEVDCWSMGVLLYTLVYGAMPFDGSNFKKLVTQISEGDFFEPKKKSKASDLIHRLLTVDPIKRATIVDICTDLWVNQGYEHSLLQVAEDMANLTPVRLDLLLALAPMSSSSEDLKEKSDSEILAQSVLEKGVEEEEEEEEEEDEEEGQQSPDTMTDSFAFVRGSQVSDFSASSPDLQKSICKGDQNKDIELSAKRAAEKSFDGSLMHVSSTAHKSKKTRKSDSNNLNVSQPASSNVPSKEKEVMKSPSNKVDTDKIPVNNAKESTVIPNQPSVNKVSQPIASKRNENKMPDNQVTKDNKVERRVSLPKSGEAELADKQEMQGKKIGRPPGKIIIPKTFESPQTTPSPKSSSIKTSPSPLSVHCKPELKTKSDDLVSSNQPNEDLRSHCKATELSQADSKVDPTLENCYVPSQEISQEKRMIAKGILKKGIAKAKLTERKLSQQGSFESEVSTPPSALIKSAEPLPSFYKAPKPYKKEDAEEKREESKAEIVLSSAASVKPNDVNKTTESPKNSTASLWDSVPDQNYLPVQKRNTSWGTISSTLDSEMSNWREQMEESLRRLSPDGSAEQSVSLVASEDKPLVPIARSYKKFTFTKDGACITETKKIYTTPGADGSWTKVEKKTRITTRPGNTEEFERFRDLHLRPDSPLTRSDSQSSSGSNEMYEDIFDQWTGDNMMCNMRKIKNMFHKFSRDPFMHSDRRKNPFKNFRRHENERIFRRPELRSGQSTDKESSDNDEEECEISFDGHNPVLSGSQGLWQFLRPSSRRLPRRLMVSQPERDSFTRSVSQERSGTKLGSWKHSESRASSGYNTNSRSQSRDRTQSPHEKVLRFVFETPSREQGQNKGEGWRFKNTSSNNRRDSGVNSDGYESEHSYRRVTSDDFSKSGRVSPLSSVCSPGRNSLIREFMKSWPKESGYQDVGNETADNRRYKVEQWLHMNDMNDDGFPFYQDPRLVSPRKTNIHDNISSTYGTVRPREYMRYNRSASDNTTDCTVDIFPGDESTRSPHRDQNFLKNRVRTSTYSPVSEGSSRDVHSLHNSDSSHSNASVHRINFTFSDGRVSSASQSPQSMIRPAQIICDNGSEDRSRNIQVKGPPTIQMRVSFNRGNMDNKVVHITSQSPPSSIGLWQHQDPNQTYGNVAKKELSPVPGIKKFSTEMVHTVGSASDGDSEKAGSHCSPIECEVKTTVKNPAGSFRKGELCRCVSASVCSEGACTCMENSTMPCNLNLRPSHSFSPTSEYSQSIGNDAFFSQTSTKDINTPDSLEDSSILSQDRSPVRHNFTPEIASLDNLLLDIKPLGVLWNSYDDSNLKKNKSSQVDLNYDVIFDDIDIPGEIKKTPDGYGSIWEQKNVNNNFETAVNPNESRNSLGNRQNIAPDNTLLKMHISPLSVLDTMTVIEGYQFKNPTATAEFSGIMPSLMDDLESPKKVLHQALKISNP